jgi:hypothetical protein
MELRYSQKPLKAAEVLSSIMGGSREQLSDITTLLQERKNSQGIYENAVANNTTGIISFTVWNNEN